MSEPINVREELKKEVRSTLDKLLSEHSPHVGNPFYYGEYTDKFVTIIDTYTDNLVAKATLNTRIDELETILKWTVSGTIKSVGYSRGVIRQDAVRDRMETFKDERRNALTKEQREEYKNE